MKESKSLPHTLISKHELVPKHEVLKQKEAAETLSAMGLTPANVPKIFIDDPAIAELDPKLGDIIRITRKESIGENIYYRVVVN